MAEHRARGRRFEPGGVRRVPPNHPDGGGSGRSGNAAEHRHHGLYGDRHDEPVPRRHLAAHPSRAPPPLMACAASHENVPAATRPARVASVSFRSGAPHNNRLQTDAAIAFLSSSFPPVQAKFIRAARLNRGVMLLTRL